MKKKLIVSACLLGERCRYDGETKYVSGFLDSIKEYEIIPFCPEAPLFGTPRERISVVKVGEDERIITDESRVDVTLRLKEEIASFIKKNPDPDAIILKSKSPSCGIGTTPILKEDKSLLKYGNGIAANMFFDAYKDVKIVDENNTTEL